MDQVLIKKSGGDIEPFNPGKLIQSLQRAGAKPDMISKVVSLIQADLVPGMSTGDIYKSAFGLLRKFSRPVAARYSLKRALLELGPSGFPFEDYLAEIFKKKGYKTQTRVMLKGACVEHEVDMIAENADRRIIAEAKFHNELGLKSDLKVALYVNARMDDIRKRETGGGLRLEGYLITNTKFTKAALAYSECVGLNLIGWAYPRYGNLHDLIDETEAHPLTALTSLSKSEKLSLMGKGIVLCRGVEENRDALAEAGVTGRRLETVLEEGRHVCSAQL